MTIIKKLLGLIFFIAILQNVQIKSMDNVISLIKKHSSKTLNKLTTVDSKLQTFVSSHKYKLMCLAILFSAIYKNENFRELLKEGLPIIKSIFIGFATFMFFNKLKKHDQLCIFWVTVLSLSVSIYVQLTLTDALKNAIENNNIFKTKALILLGADLNGIFVDSSIKDAASNNSLEIVKLLMSKYVKPFLTKKSINQALLDCIFYNNIEIAEILLQNGANSDRRLILPFFLSPEMAELLIKYGANVNVNWKIDDTKSTLLHSNLQVTIANIFINAGANINAQTIKASLL